MDERYDEKGNLKESFIDKRTGIEYNLVGDYYLPNLVLEAEEKVILNKYGLLRLNYLKEHKKADYTIMFMNKTLNKHLKVVATHLNTDNVHNHIVINSVSFKSGNKFYSNRETKDFIRITSDFICRENRLRVIKTPWKNKGYYKLYVKNNPYMQLVKKRYR